MSKIRSYIVFTLIFAPTLVLAAPRDLPPGNPITFGIIDTIAAMLLNFIIGLAFTAMVASVIISGIMIVASRGDTSKYGKALASLKTAIWGSFVILGSGVLINTIWAVVTRDFFCQLSLIGICIIK